LGEREGCRLSIVFIAAYFITSALYRNDTSQHRHHESSYDSLFQLVAAEMDLYVHINMV
jgi:hypothetical protein